MHGGWSGKRFVDCPYRGVSANSGCTCTCSVRFYRRVNRTDGTAESLSDRVAEAAPGWSDAFADYNKRITPFSDPHKLTTDEFERRYKWTNKKMAEVQNACDRIRTPSGVGRIIGNIKAQCSGFTAAQIKNFHLIHAPVMLSDFVSPKCYEIWELYHQALEIVCRPVIAQADVVTLRSLISDFCFRFEERYAEDQTTPNMHQHMHFPDCLLDYGPAPGFWLFAFERYNGILSDIPTNGADIHLTLMKAMLDHRMLNDLPLLSSLNPILLRCERANTERWQEFLRLFTQLKLKSRKTSSSTTDPAENVRAHR